MVCHHYGKKKGIRWMQNGLKVYYVPHLCIVQHTIFPTVFGPVALLRHIFIREGVSIFHGHVSFSPFTLHAISAANFLNIPVIMTEHSLGSFDKTSNLVVNYLLRWKLCATDRVICVSNSCEQNYKWRGHFDRIDVITNAIDIQKFYPRTEEEQIKYRRDDGRVVVTILSRLTIRKGTELMCTVIPQICQRHPNVYFKIGGDGDERYVVEGMVDSHGLRDRVETRGFIPHVEARNFLVEGDIFLSCSLTEAFGIAILEAACSGLYVVSTNVDAIPQVLPSHMISLANPSTDSLVEKLSYAIEHIREKNTSRYHDILRPLYSWERVASQTVDVYKRVRSYRKQPWYMYILKYFKIGPLSGVQFSLVYFVFVLIFFVLDLLYPEDEIEKAVDCM